jgi:creatinine amidohydrolase
MATRRRVRFGGDVPFGWVSSDLHLSGVVGDPTLASAERGALLVEGMVASLAEALAEIAAFEFPA